MPDAQPSHRQPLIDGRRIIPGSIFSTAVEIPFRPKSIAAPGGGLGVYLETDNRNKRALLWWDTENLQLVVTYDGEDYVIGP